MFLGDGQGVGTILNDDSAVGGLTVIVDSVTVTGDPVNPISAFFDVFFAAPIGLAESLAGYNIIVSLNPAASGLSLTGGE